MAFPNIIRSITLHLVLCLQMVTQFNFRSNDAKSYTRKELWNISFEMKSLAIYTCQIVTRYDDWRVPVRRWNGDGCRTKRWGLFQITLKTTDQRGEASDSELWWPLTALGHLAFCLGKHQTRAYQKWHFQRMQFT